MSTLEVEMVDIHEWEAEESPDNREEERKKIKDLLIKSIIANKGNPGMVNRLLKSGVTDPQKHKCHAAFIWYTIEQEPAQPGETAYTDKSEWVDRAANWAPLLLRAIGESGGIEARLMDKILGQTRKRICIDVDEHCAVDLMPFVQELRREDETLARPNVGIHSYKIGLCEIQLNSAEAYNNHVRNIHGVKTEVREEQHLGTLNPDQGNNTQEPSNNEGITKVLNVMVPTLKSISARMGNTYL